MKTGPGADDPEPAIPTRTCRVKETDQPQQLPCPFGQYTLLPLRLGCCGD